MQKVAPQLPNNSPEDTAELTFFFCGNGDTILIRGGDKWALVDANLTITHGTKQRLEDFLDHHGNPPLEFVCITHFDQDHIRGLGDFLEGRYRAGKNQPWRIGQIILPTNPPLLFIQFMKALHQSGSFTKSLKSLADRLYAFRQANGEDRLRYYQQGAMLRDVKDASYRLSFGPWDVYVMGPKNQTSSSFTEHCYDDVAQKYHIPRFRDHDEVKKRITQNGLSVILLLVHQTTEKVVMLTGDSTEEEQEHAMRMLNSLHKERGVNRQIQIVKASHHGSKNGYHPPLYRQHCQSEESHVIFSSLGNDQDDPHPPWHPDLVMLRDLHSMNLKTKITGPAILPPQDRPHKLPGVALPIPVTHRDISVSMRLSQPVVKNGIPGDQYLLTMNTLIQKFL